MKVYAFSFIGHYPVGAYGIAIANSKKAALKLAKHQIALNGLAAKNMKFSRDDIELVWEDSEAATAAILSDEDY